FQIISDQPFIQKSLFSDTNDPILHPAHLVHCYLTPHEQSIFTPSACGATEFRNLSTLIDVVVWNNMPKSEHTWLLKGMASDTLSR
uniref:Uncharacterized protein n=1 Tax=Astyanax mexicanus TaxID=7994 RepID=A0A3B1J394_ASTMX